MIGVELIHWLVWQPFLIGVVLLEMELPLVPDQAAFLFLVQSPAHAWIPALHLSLGSPPSVEVTAVLALLGNTAAAVAA